MNKHKKAFTLIELIVTIAVLGILVLLASPRFFGHTQNTEFTKGFANARSIEKASELYYMDHEDWPRLTDEPYTSEEIESYSERIFDRTGQEVNLNPDGNYYDIDYDKLSDYIQVPDDKKNYILQNPVGKVFYMNNLNEAGIARVNYSSTKEDDNPGGLRKPITGEIVIDSADKLAKIGTSSEYPLNGKYILTANIDLSVYSEEGWIPIGNYYNTKFTGSFDGNGYKIINLTINKPSQSYVGLFGSTQGATIRNVGLIDSTVTGRDQVGGLVGYAESSTIISNSYATGEVEGSGNYVGGLVGGTYSSTEISNSYSTGSVTGKDNVGGLVGLANASTTIRSSYATGSVTGTTQVGGLVGLASSGNTITSSYATGSVTGKDRVGGLVGWVSQNTIIKDSYATGPAAGLGERVGGLVGGAYNGTEIINSYAIGPVSGKSSVGGLVGWADYRYKISNSYWDTKTTGRTTSAGGGIGKTTDEMKLKGTYSGWGFETVWKIDEGKDYPKLR